MTAHSTQGRTLASAIIVLQIGRGVSAIASYVAMTRVRTRLDLLIYRNFEREVFAKGEPEGPALLLKVLRGENVDWKAVEDKPTPKGMCSGPCLSVRFKDEFGVEQWTNAEDPLCKACVQKLQEQGTPYRCTRCRQWFAKESFADSSLSHNGRQKLCRGCVANHVRACCICNKDKPSTDSTDAMWKKVVSPHKCKECMLGRTCICEKPRTQCKFAVGEWIKPDAQRACIKKKKAKLQFSRQQSSRNATDRLCCDCDRKRCSQCNKEKGYKDFSHAIWDWDVGSPELLCTQCVAGGRQRGFWKCANKRCGKQKPLSKFGMAIAKHGKGVNGHSKQCDACLERHEEEVAKMTRSSLEHLQKKRKQ
jgi:hypothetical protein